MSRSRAWAELELKEIEIEFRAEATFGETVETRCDTETYHGDGRPARDRR